MNKKALLTGIFLMAILGLCFLSGEKTIYGISEGTYELSEEIEGCVPVIHFDMSSSEIRFTMAADRRISMAYRGRVELDGRVHAIADNGKDRWIFEVLDNERIAFVCSGSTELKLGSQVTLPDGAIFEISQP